MAIDSKALRRRLAPLDRIIQAAVARYEELGSVRGNLRIPDLTEDERIALSGLLGDHVRTKPGETLVLPLKRLDEMLRTRSLGDGLLDVAATISSRPIETRAERAASVQERWERLLSEGLPSSDGVALRWRKRLLAGDSCSITLLHREFQQEEREGHGTHGPLAHALQIVTAALDDLPALRNRTTRLPVFANMHTGNPHGFDEAQFTGRLLLRALTDMLGPSHGFATPPDEAAERGLLLSAAGLLPDGVSSTVACFGLRAADRADGSADPQVTAAYADRQVLIAPLRQASQWTSLDCGPLLLAVENPPVFEELIDGLLTSRKIVPIICTSGYLSVAAYTVLDLAVRSGATIWYGGDFDANGLAIAARLGTRYGERLRFWRMSPAEYDLAASHPLARALEETERRKLGRIDCPGLAEVAEHILNRGTVAFQESLVELLKQDVIANPHR